MVDSGWSAAIQPYKQHFIHFFWHSSNKYHKKSHNSPSVKLIWPLSKSLSSSHLVIFPLIQHVNSENWLFAYPLAHARSRQMLLLWENQCLSVLLQCFICEWSEFFASSFYRILERHVIKTAGSDGALYGCKSAWDMNDDEGEKKKKKPCVSDETPGQFASNTFWVVCNEHIPLKRCI